MDCGFRFTQRQVMAMVDSDLMKMVKEDVRTALVRLYLECHTSTLAAFENVSSLSSALIFLKVGAMNEI